MIFHGHDVEGIDVNVYTDGNEPVVISVYPTYTGADGFTHTNTTAPLVSIVTELDRGLWSDDWFGFDGTTMPGEFPGDVLAYVLPLIA